MKSSGRMNFTKIVSIAFFVMMIWHVLSLVIFAVAGVTKHIYSEICFVGMSACYWLSSRDKNPHEKPTQSEWILFAIGCAFFVAGEIIVH